MFFRRAASAQPTTRQRRSHRQPATRTALHVEPLQDRSLPSTTIPVAPGPAPAFEIKDFPFSIENPSTIGSATGGAGAGKANFNESTIKKTTDSASPALFETATGAAYEAVILEMRK